MTIWFLIYSIAAGQALLLAAALWQRPFDRHANRLLAGWMLLVCVDLGVRAWAQWDGSGGSYKPMRLVALFPFLHVSAFYLYVRTLISSSPLDRRDWVHAGCFLLALMLSMDAFLASSEQIEFARQHGLQLGYWRHGPWSDLFLFASSVAYIVAALRAIGKQRRRLLDTRSDADPNGYRWLIVVAASQCLIWLVALFTSALPFVSQGNQLIYAAVAAWVLLAGYMSMLQPSAGLSKPVPDEQVRNEQGREAPPDQQARSDDADDPRFDAVAERLRGLLEEQQLYRETALTIGQLARRSGYPEYLVSAVINRRFGCPFWDYVNRYRVEAARRCLSDPDDQRTALDIAYDCGFSSKSTFNAAFKRFLGETPSELRNRASAAGRSVRGPDTDRSPPPAG